MVSSADPSYVHDNRVGPSVMNHTPWISMVGCAIVDFERRLPKPLAQKTDLKAFRFGPAAMR
jgi:hypothetical protein